MREPGERVCRNTVVRRAQTRRDACGDRCLRGDVRQGALGGKAAVRASAGATAAQPGAMSDVVAETDDETIARCAPRVAAVMSRAKGGKRRAAEAESAQSAKRDKEDTTSMKEEGTDGDGTTKLPPVRNRCINCVTHSGLISCALVRLYVRA